MTWSINFRGPGDRFRDELTRRVAQAHDAATPDEWQLIGTVADMIDGYTANADPAALVEVNASGWAPAPGTGNYGFSVAVNVTPASQPKPERPVWVPGQGNKALAPSMTTPTRAPGASASDTPGTEGAPAPGAAPVPAAPEPGTPTAPADGGPGPGGRVGG